MVFSSFFLKLFHYSDKTNICDKDFFIASEMSKYGVISGPYFPVFSSNIGQYGPEITPYLNTFHAVI